MSSLKQQTPMGEVALHTTKFGGFLGSLGATNGNYGGCGGREKRTQDRYRLTVIWPSSGLGEKGVLAS